MNPEDRGWYGQVGHYFQNLTDKDHAPTDLLEMVRCNWKACCNTHRCTCRKHGLESSTGCGHCSGVCSNVNILLDDVDEDVHDD